MADYNETITAPVIARRWLSGRLAINNDVARTVGTTASLGEGLAQRPE